MELYKEILAKVIEKEEMQIIFPNLQISVAEIIKIESYEALQKIKTIIGNDSLSDSECIEKIVCVLENIGSNGGNRHDFG